MKLSYYSMLHPTVTNNNHLTCYFSLSITQYNCHRRFACSLHFLNPSEFRNDSSLLKSFHIEKGTEISALLYIREIGEMMKGIIMAVMQAEQLKLDGNLWFLKNRFDAAIEAYTEAITLCPDVANYWTSRALCHRKRNDWIRVEEDCKKAVQLDHNSVKAHHMLGLALIHRKSYPDGIKALEKSFDLARGAHPHSYMVEEIWQELAKAKFQQWEQDSIQRSWDLQNLKAYFEKAILEKYSQVEGFTDEITDSVSRKLQDLNSVFAKTSQDDTPTEIPDYLCCRITLDIFRDPVIAPSGLTYERAVILKHLHKVGMFDPITRQPLDPSQLVENMAIKEAVRAFLETHGWAYRID